ncbi:MAG: YifB family Mg chelatase-like AAA ATPase [Solirubrobacteraceae bacterium]
MLARARTFTIDGLRARPVTVEVDIRPGLPAFTIVGLAGAPVREARDRVRAAVLNSGYEFPGRRITANLAPADLPKAGPGLDLALACALLAASEQAPAEPLERCALFGELGLDGELRDSHGALAVAEAAKRAGLRLLLGPGCAREALLVDDLDVGVVERLSSAVRVLAGGEPDPLPEAAAQLARPQAHPALDFDEVRGQRHAIWALTVAAAGAHNSLLCGPPGTGKTMLAQRLPSILPALSRAEAIEVTRIHCGGRKLQATGLIGDRPFRAPHHSITAAGLIGSAHNGWVGEAVLAHNGVLFLDELSEFARSTLDALRQPLEEGTVAIARARHRAVYPARFMLVAATNPCPCGYAGELERCRCSEADMARHRRRLSGPLLDRIDMSVMVGEAPVEELRSTPYATSARLRERVHCARRRQSRRLREEGVLVNAHMNARMLRAHVRLDDAAETVLTDAHRQGLLSARGAHRVLRVARTLADLRGEERVRADRVAEALTLRGDALLCNRRAA